MITSSTPIAKIEIFRERQRNPLSAKGKHLRNLSFGLWLEFTTPPISFSFE